MQRTQKRAGAALYFTMDIAHTGRSARLPNCRILELECKPTFPNCGILKIESIRDGFAQKVTRQQYSTASEARRMAHSTNQPSEFRRNVECATAALRSRYCTDRSTLTKIRVFVQSHSGSIRAVDGPEIGLE